MKTDFLIIGGGVSGLSAALELAKAGADVTALEAGTYPAHKMCGEFLSPEAIPLLEAWEIAVEEEISTVNLRCLKSSWSMELPRRAVTIDRFTLEERLAKKARTYGAEIKTSAKVQSIKSEGGFWVALLETGERWQAKTLLVSTGRRIPGFIELPDTQFCYIGAKAHFEGIQMPSELVMHLFPGAYFGMVPIGKGRVNVAGLIACSHEEALRPQKTLEAFWSRQESCHLKKVLDGATKVFPEWMAGPVPEFGVRNYPQKENVFFLGDAAGVIPPATGSGLAMGLTAGAIAAEYALRADLSGYKKRWKSEYKNRIFFGKLLHSLFLSRISGWIPAIAKAFPYLPEAIFRRTRG